MFRIYFIVFVLFGGYLFVATRFIVDPIASTSTIASYSRALVANVVVSNSRDRVMLENRISDYAKQFITEEPTVRNQSILKRIIDNFSVGQLGYLYCQPNWDCFTTPQPFHVHRRVRWRADTVGTRTSIVAADFEAQIATSLPMRGQQRLIATVEAMIRRARREILICTYGFDSLPEITRLLQSKMDAGVIVKVVVDRLPKNAGRRYLYRDTTRLLNLVGKFSRVENSHLSAIMHNKFIVVDGRYVWTGSANLTRRALVEHRHSNVIITIKSRAIAQAYRNEFFEMYRGYFHRAKRTNTIRHFYFKKNKVDVRLFFAPTDDGLHRGILPALYGARKTIRVSMFTTGLGPTVVAFDDALKRGVRIRILLDRRQASLINSWFFPRKNSESHARFIAPSRIDLVGLSLCDIQKKYGNDRLKIRLHTWAGHHHEKIALIDHNTAILGSQNWTKSGNDRNDENLLIIHEHKAKLTRQLHQHFDELWNLSKPQNRYCGKS